MRVRYNDDGSFWIPRADIMAEAHYDSYCYRIPGTLSWYPPTDDLDSSMEQLKEIHTGHPAYIVGKGPSLDLLTKDYFEDDDGPVFCINHAVNKVEALGLTNLIYLIQSDMTDDWDLDPMTMCMLNYRARAAHPNHPRRMVYNFKRGNTAAQAVSLAIELGCKPVLMCFDASVNQKEEHAECMSLLGPASGRNYARANRVMYAEMKDHDNEWIIPGDPLRYKSSSSCRPEPLSDNLEEHHVPQYNQPTTSSPTTPDLPLKTEQSQHESSPDHSDSTQRSLNLDSDSGTVHHTD